MRIGEKALRSLNGNDKILNGIFSFFVNFFFFRSTILAFVAECIRQRSGKKCHFTMRATWVAFIFVDNCGFFMFGIF